MSQNESKIITTTKPDPADRMINEALHILSAFGVPIEGLTVRRMERMALAFLAVAGLKPGDSWVAVKSREQGYALKTREIIEYVNTHFGENISSGSYDDIRRKDLKLPVLAEIILPSSADPNAARNNPTRAYALNPRFADVVKTYGTPAWVEAVRIFMEQRVTLRDVLTDERIVKGVPITVKAGTTLVFSPGKHNELQMAIIEKFLPRYGHGAEVLYVGDTAHKLLFLDEKRLKELNFFELSHGELPDVLAYSATKKWLYLIEAVHSANPISPVRHMELKRLTSACKAGIIYVTAFPDRQAFRRFAHVIAWETDVWIAESPDHLVHFDGSQFLGPYKS